MRPTRFGERRWWTTGLLLASIWVWGAAALAAPDAGRPDAGAADGAVQDAGPPEPAPAPDPPAPPAVVVPEAVDVSGVDRAALTRQIGHLKAVITEQLPLEVTVPGVVGLDLLDEAAVRAQVEALRAQVERRTARLRWLEAVDDPLPEPDAGVPDAALPDAALRDGGAADGAMVASKPADALDAGVSGPQDAGVSEAGVADAATVHAVADAPPDPRPRTQLEDDELAMLGLLNERDGLLLDVLGRPLVERTALVEANAERHRLAAQEAAEAVAAEAARRAAEEASKREAAALAEAAKARSAAERQMAEARAAAEAVRGALAERSVAAAEARLVFARQTSERRGLTKRIEAQLDGWSLQAEAANELYAETVASLVVIRAAFDASLSRDTTPPKLPDAAVGLNLDAPEFRALPVGRDALLQVLEAIEADRATLFEALTAAQVHERETLATDLHAINHARLNLLPRLSADRREALLGLGSEGLKQLGRELDQLRLSTRWYIRYRSRRLAELPVELVEAVGHGSRRWAAIRVLVFLLLGLVLLIRRRRILEAGDEAVLAWRADRKDRRWARRVWRHARALMPAVAFWSLAHLIFDGASDLLPDVEIRVVGRVAILYATYRLIIAAVHRLLVALGSTPRAPVTAELSARLLRSVRTAGRYVLVVKVFLSIASAILGRGYLYTVVEEFAWLGAIPIGWWLVRHWRPDVTAAYCSRFPQGWLVPWIERGQRRWWGLLTTVPAFVQVAAQILGASLVRLSLRVGRIRRALAYLFRRRLEKQAGDRVVASVGPALPEAMRAALRAPADDETRVARLPGLQATLARIETWHGGHDHSPTALVGERGSGKTTWLDALESQVRHPVTRILLAESVGTPTAAMRRLSTALDLPQADAPEALAEALLAGPRRIILLDDAHHLLQRAPGGAASLRAFITLLRRTASHVFWVCAFGRFMWTYLGFLLRDQDAFSQVFVLRGWTEDGLADLIEPRLSAAALTLAYDDLMVDPTRTFDREDELLRTRERYLRLLWDHVDGSPGMALHFWVASLVHDGPGKARVRLFEHPSADDLEHLGELSRFVLYAVTLHDGLAFSEAPLVLQLDAAKARTSLEHLSAVGCLARDPEADRYAVPDPWYPAVVRFLRRKHMLHT